MGISAQQMLGNDPEYLRRQYARQEIEKYQNFQNPQIGLASTSGALLGRGIANLFGGRGFFEASDPGLRAVTEVNKIATDILSGIDPTKPEDMVKGYAEIAKQLAASGYSQPAFMAAQEAAKLQAAIGGGYKESDTYMTKTGAPALFKNGKYYDPNGNDLKTDELKLIPKDAFGRVIDTVGAGATGTGAETQAQKAAKALADRQSKAKADAAKATADPLAPKWDDSPKTAAAKAQARAERDAQKAAELSNMGGIGTEMVAP